MSLCGEAASADKAAARHYVEDVFPKIIEENGYLTEQVFNMDESGLFWKGCRPNISIQERTKQARAQGPLRSSNIPHV